LIWKPSAAVGEQSWINYVLPSECQVKINLETLLRNCGSVVAVSVVLFFAFRLAAKRGPLVSTLTNRRLAVLSLLLAVCFPIPGSHGMPLAFLLIMAPISLFSDNGHLGPWFVPIIAGAAFVVYFTPIFLLASTMVWLARRRANPSSLSV
jgi:hypothetical protein